MSSIQEHQQQALILLSRCMQKPGNWIIERITDGQLAQSISSLFQTPEDYKNSQIQNLTDDTPLANLLSLITSYQGQAPAKIKSELTRQYLRWTRVETNTMTVVNPPSPFKETEDPLGSYRHLPGQEIMEWYHCCGMKMPKRFVGRPDSIHMKLEFTIYLTGIISQQPENPDHIRTYDVFLRRFLLPHIDRILAHRCGSEQFYFYYTLCAFIRSYLT